MVILELYQGDYKKDLVAFDSLEEGRAFVAQIPGYSLEIEDGFEVEFLTLQTYQIIWRLFITETLYPCLNGCSTLRKLWSLFGRKFQICPLKTIK